MYAMAVCAFLHLSFQHEWDEVSTPLASWSDDPFCDDPVRIVAEQKAIVKASELSSRAFSFQGPLTFDQTEQSEGRTDPAACANWPMELTLLRELHRACVLGLPVHESVHPLNSIPAAHTCLA